MYIVSSVFRIKYFLPLRCSMPLHNFSGTNEGIVKMCPPCRGLIQKSFDQLFRSASGVILNNDLKASQAWT